MYRKYVEPCEHKHFVQHETADSKQRAFIAVLVIFHGKH